MPSQHINSPHPVEVPAVRDKEVCLFALLIAKVQ
jgi:hypothetical protein